jgi:sugar/nucleoside kinase (ribokinase family)
MACDVLCAGIVVADFVCDPVAEIPAAGALVETSAIAMSIGGCASNVAVDLCRLGRTAHVAGRVGRDVPGRFVREALLAAGVQTACLLETPEAPTSATLVINVRGQDRRFIHAVGANSLVDGTEFDLANIGQFKVVYLGGFFLMPRLRGGQAARLFRAAREAGLPTVLDVVVAAAGSHWSELEQVLPHTSIFMPNHDEARLLTGLDDPLQQARRFIAAGADTVVITLGGHGALLATRDRALLAGAFLVPFVDGTGSGDAFAAGYISALIDGMPPEACLEAGSALGASCVRAPGATTGVFDREELNGFLREHKLLIRPAG